MQKSSAAILIVLCVLIVLVAGLSWIFDSVGTKPSRLSADAPRIYQIEGRFVRVDFEKQTPFVVLEILNPGGATELRRGAVVFGKTVFNKYSESGREPLNMMDVRPGDGLMFTTSQDPKILNTVVLDSVELKI